MAKFAHSESLKAAVSSDLTDAVALLEGIAEQFRAEGFAECHKFWTAQAASLGRKAAWYESEKDAKARKAAELRKQLAELEAEVEVEA